MSKLKLLKEPGYIYDLNFIFCLKFNTKLYIDILPEDDKKEEYIKYFKDILVQFGDVPEDLYVFFHAIDTGRAFLPSCYFNAYQDQFINAYNFKFLQKELSDFNKLIRNLIKFYFYDLNDETVEQCATSLNKIFSYIKNSDYSEEEKNRLYEFFINPTSYIQTLLQQLIIKDFALSEYYKNNYQKIIDLYNRTTPELLLEQLNNFRNLNFIADANGILYVSYCLLHNFFIVFYYLTNDVLALIGSDYVSVLNSTRDTKQQPDLYGLGTALCEESRVKILQFVYENDEITCKDLEKAFSFSGSTAYHHIAIMAKSGLIKTRNEGKTILYSINKKYVANIINILNKYLNKKGN